MFISMDMDRSRRVRGGVDADLDDDDKGEEEDEEDEDFTAVVSSLFESSSVPFGKAFVSFTSRETDDATPLSPDDDEADDFGLPANLFFPPFLLLYSRDSALLPLLLLLSVVLPCCNHALLIGFTTKEAIR